MVNHLKQRCVSLHGESATLFFYQLIGDIQGINDGSVIFQAKPHAFGKFFAHLGLPNDQLDNFHG
jgi:hypothetical protein